jgi:hypothetical protein
MQQHLVLCLQHQELIQVLTEKVVLLGMAVLLVILVLGEQEMLALLVVAVAEVVAEAVEVVEQDILAQKV